ncbi:MAG: pyroglutamyl-peptidase I [Firmicutes bacterium]|nr:pyroglutamyl-peptidase I [Bacillota bacterium]
MKKLLMTAFEPFGGEDINASQEVLKRLPDQIGEWKIVKLTVPVVFGDAAASVIAQASEIQPDAIISLGQAAGRSKVTPEYVAINFKNARIPDNSGNQPLREKISEIGPAAYFSTLPVFEMAEAITGNGLPGEVSFTAGTYVCNDLFYSLLDHFSGTGTGIDFIHLPLTPGQAAYGQPFLELNDMVKAVLNAVSAI